jgi:hypothetical protein
MEMGETSKPSAAERAENIARFNVWAGIYQAAAEDMLHLDGMAVGFTKDTALITIPDKRFPAVTIQYVAGTPQSPERILVADHTVTPIEAEDLLLTRSTTIFRSGGAAFTNTILQRVSRKGLATETLETHSRPSNEGDLAVVDSRFVELDNARRNFITKRAERLAAPKRLTIAQRLSKLLGSKIIK